MSNVPWQLFPLLFVGMWALILVVLSRFGWASLASVYRAERPFEGKRWRFVDAKVGKLHWSRSLTLGANDEGLFLVPSPIYRLAHPALFVPWSDITVAWKRTWGLQFVQLTPRRVAEVPIFLTESRARAVALAAGAAWPAPELLERIELRRGTVSRGGTVAAYAAIALFVFSCVAIGLGALGVPRYWELDRGGEVATARVTSIEPENHYSLRYAYNVGGVEYSGVGSIADGGSASLRLGAPVTIHYMRQNLSVSCLGDPHGELVNEAAFAALAGAAVALGVVLSLRSVGFVVRRHGSSSI